MPIYKKDNDVQQKPFVSIVIPAYNAEKYIGIIIDALDRQQYSGKYEIILMDNESCDKTRAIGRQCPKVKIYSVKRGSSISSIRNFGASYSKGEILAFLDSDCLPDSNWLNLGVKIIESNNKIGILGGSYIVPSESTWVQRAWASIREKQRGSVNYLPSGNLFIKKSVFNEFGGFKIEFETGEDFEFCFRISKKYLVYFDERLGVVHFGEAKTLLEKFRKEYWYGKSLMQILKIKKIYFSLYGTIILGILFMTGLGLLLFGKIVLCVKFVSLIFILLVLDSLYYCRGSRNYKYFPQLIIIFSVYNLARFSSILNHILTFRFKKSDT